MGVSSNMINVSSYQPLKHKEKQNWTYFFALQIGYKIKPPNLYFVKLQELLLGEIWYVLFSPLCFRIQRKKNLSPV